MPNGTMFTEMFKCPRCGHEERIKRYTGSRGRKVQTWCYKCKKYSAVVSGGNREQPVPHNLPRPREQLGPKDPRPIPLLPGVRIIVFGVNRETSWEVQVYPFPDLTLDVTWDGSEFVHDGIPYKGRLMLGGIWGETSYSVPVRVICTNDASNSQAYHLFKRLKQNGWVVEGSGRDVETVKA